MKKKSQTQQIFIYIVAIILFALILAYGYKAINDFRKRTDEVSLLQMEKDISSTVKRVAPDYGTIVKKELSIPLKYEKVCFVDLVTSNTVPLNTELCNDIKDDYNYIACNSWEDKASYNMFCISNGDTLTYDIGRVKIEDPYYFCIASVNGKITLRLEGKGDHAMLSNWAYS